MSKGLLRSIGRAVTASAGARVLTMNVPLRGFVVSNIDGASGVGWGSGVISGLPEGNILILGAVINVILTEATGSISDTFAGDIGVGSTPASDGTISAGDVDFIPSTAMGPAASSSTTVRGASTGTESGVVLDNTTNSLELNLNILIDDADISADDLSMTVDGVFHLAYAMLGDD